MRGLRASTSTRLVLAISACFLAGFLCLGLLVYSQVQRQLDRDTRAFVHADAAELVDLYRASGLAALGAEVARRHADPEDADMFYALADRGGRLLAGDATRAMRCGEAAQWRVQRPAGGGARVFARSVPLGASLCLVTGMRANAADGFLAVMLRAAGYAWLIAVLLGLLSGWMVSRWVAHRLESIEAVATRVGAGELSRRVRPDGSGDAFDRIGQRINAMLDRIGALVDGVRQVTDHIAHDLRTPLTRLRNRIDALRALPQSAHAQLELDAALVETDGLLQTFASLLRLSRLEADATPPLQAEVDLQALARDALELYAPSANDAGLRLRDMTQPARARGDADLLFQMAVNLMDNAVKYGARGGDLVVATGGDARQAWLEVADRGPGIAAADRARAFDRFERLDADRGTPGNGLGLSMARAIARRHRGDIELADNAPGLRVRAWLPGALQPP